MSRLSLTAKKRVMTFRGGCTWVSRLFIWVCLQQERKSGGNGREIVPPNYFASLLIIRGDLAEAPISRGCKSINVQQGHRLSLGLES